MMPAASIIYSSCPSSSWSSFFRRFQRRYDGIYRNTLYGSIKTQYDILLMSIPIDEEFVRQTILSLMEANSYRVAFHSLKITSAAATSVERRQQQPLIEAATASASCVCVVVSQTSYFHCEDDLIPLSKLCQNKPLGTYLTIDTDT